MLRREVDQHYKDYLSFYFFFRYFDDLTHIQNMAESGTGVRSFLPSPSTCSPPCITWSVAPPPPPPATVSLARSCSDCGGKGQGDAKSGGGVRPFRRILSETW